MSLNADLILGSGFFRSGILQIDYPNSRLRFLPKKAVNLTNLKMSSRQCRQKISPPTWAAGTIPAVLADSSVA